MRNYMISLLVGMMFSCGGTLPPEKIPVVANVAKIQKSALLQQIELLPAETTVVAGISVRELMATSVAKKVLEIWGKSREGEEALQALVEVEKKCGISFLQNFDWALLVFGKEYPDKSHALILDGDFTRKSVMECAPKLGLEVGSKDGVENIGYDFFLIWLSDHRVAVSFDEDSLKFLKSVAHRKKRTPLSPNFQEMMLAVDTSTTVWAAGDMSGEEYSMYEDLGLDDVSEGAPQGAYISVKVGDSVAVEAGIRFASSVHAANNVKAWKLGLESLFDKELVGYYVRQIEVSQRETDSLGKITIDAKSTSSALAMVEHGVEQGREDERKWKEREKEEAKRDSDGDGIVDRSDKCPKVPEDKDGFKDKDGCPEKDNDGDGIVDGEDACPNSAETVNGYKDKDGCPDAAKKKTEEQQKKAEAHLDQGHAYLKTGVYEKAVEEFKAAYKLYPHEAFLYDIAYSYDSMRRQEARALEYYKKYLKASPSGENARLSRQRVAALAKILRRRNR